MTPSRSSRLLAAPLSLALALALVGCLEEGDPTAAPAASSPAPTVPGDAGTGRPDASPDVPAPDGGDEPQADVAHWDGFGPATFGMTADAVRAAWTGDLGDNPVEEPACFHLSPTSQPDYAYFAMMFGEGRLVRYSVSNDAMSAPGGGRRGMSGDEIEAMYPGRVERSPHKYTDGAYLRIAGERDRVLVFETDDAGTVTEWRVGIPPYVDYVEGCS